jgi:hypothetical protein
MAMECAMMISLGWSLLCVQLLKVDSSWRR